MSGPRPRRTPNPLSDPRRTFYLSASHILSESSLPYHDFSKGFILQHLVDLIPDNYPKLQLEMLPVKPNNGPSFNLLQASGKILYGVENTHNIPISICFLESYPHLPPNVFVNCPDNMIIRSGVACVNTSGQVCHDYLRHWQCPSSNLVLLLKQLRDTFSRETPFDVLELQRFLSPEKMKLTKILIDNGQSDLYWRIASLPKDEIKAFFDQITHRYPRHPDLAAHIKTKEGGVSAFIEIAKDLALKKFDVVGLPSSHIGTHGCLQAGQMSPMHSIDLRQQEMQPLMKIHMEEIPKLLSNPSLPYDDPTKKIIGQHLFNLLHDYPLLGVEVDNNNLIQVYGKIPFSFRGDTYRIHVIIWLLESYPVSRPCVGLNCSVGEVIKNNLVHVAPGGMVYLPYLKNWDGLKSNLVGLVSHLSAEFTCQPPLFRSR